MSKALGINWTIAAGIALSGCSPVRIGYQDMQAALEEAFGMAHDREISVSTYDKFEGDRNQPAVATCDPISKVEMLEETENIAEVNIGFGSQTSNTSKATAHLIKFRFERPSGQTRWNLALTTARNLKLALPCRMTPIQKILG